MDAAHAGSGSTHADANPDAKQGMWQKMDSEDPWFKLAADTKRAGRIHRPPTTAHEEQHLGALLGDIMDRFGTRAVGLGLARMVESPDRGIKRMALSPRYTTEWDELPVVKAA